MCLCIFRRSLLRTAVLAPALLGCQVVPSGRLVADAPARGSGRWLDVHCHVFNGHDLPIYQFIKKTRLDQSGFGWAAPIVAFLAGGLDHDAPSPEDEMRSMAGGIGPLAAAAPLPASPAVGLGRLRNRSLGRVEAASAGLGGVGGLGTSVDADALRLIDLALREEGIRSGSGLRSPGLPQRPRAAAAGLPAPATDAELRQLSRRIESDREGRLGRYFRWGLTFAQPRGTLVASLATLYPAGADVMLTPAMVDYDAWLDAPDTRPAAQVRVMRDIAVQRARGGMPVHAFAAFDPWRCLERREEIRRGSNAPDILESLKRDLASGDAIGVKLYPPMGFAATGNDARDEISVPFPARLAELTGGRPGRALDDVLGELFDHCADRDIPVMAHCGPTNGSVDAYKDLADPRYWRLALNSPGRPRRKELRLNLGHFGGIWDLGSSSVRQRAWATEIVAMMSDFPNVYADIAYFGSVLHPEEAATVAQTKAFIADAAAAQGSALKAKLMYGSDWSMIGQEPSSQYYAHAAVEALSGTWSGDAEEDLRWRNAARFLGLSPGDGTLKRLTSFYAANSINPAPLHRFDPS